jgi:phage shock protein C
MRNRNKRLYRSTADRKVAGVCGGLAIYTDTDSTLLRLAWIAVTVLTGLVPGILGYIAAAIIMPKGSS